MISYFEFMGTRAYFGEAFLFRAMEAD